MNDEEIKDDVIEEVHNEEIGEETEDCGSGFGLGVVVGTLGTAAVIATVRKAKQLWTRHKAKKLVQSDVSDDPFDDFPFEDEVVSEDVEESEEKKVS